MDPEPPRPDIFATTRWSLVLAARERATPSSQAALSELCQAYWYPLYAYVRRRGRPQEEAEDLTQGFFAAVLAKNTFGEADRQRGKFRAFIITAFKRFLAKEHARATAQKRGGGRPTLSFDMASGEDQYRREPEHDWTAERIFERRWALTLLDRVLDRLEAEHRERGREAIFEALQGVLSGEGLAESRAETARRLGMSLTAVKVAIHRLRRRYRDLLRDEVAQTLAEPEEVDEEIRALLAALARTSPKASP